MSRYHAPSKLVKSEPTAVPQLFAPNQKTFNQNFSGGDFSKRNLRGLTFMQCTFDDCDFTDTDCTGTEFYGSSFRRTVCRNTNFKDAKLHGTVFEPTDFYGMTMTFVCETYQDMKLSRPVWDGYLFFALGLMQPPPDDDGFDPRSSLIGALGRQYFVDHFARFKARTL